MAHQSDLIAEDIEQYLQVHENKELLRFITCGNVDDGKSTLIGRLLFDSKMIFEDQLQSIESDSKKVGTQGNKIDLALLVDGLQSEREQGITIDVAYRFFSTEKRKFIIADTPGHQEYTRNMATGASTADLAIILVDARHGVQEQTKRHSFIVNQLGINKIIVAVNKMDLIDYSEEQFNAIKEDYLAFAADLGIKSPLFTPISALDGDNVVNPSEKMDWYKDGSLMQILDSIDITPETTPEEFRLPVQYVNRPNHTFRGFAGTINAGSIKVGDEIRVLPANTTSKVASIVAPAIEGDGTVDEAFAPMAVTITTEDEIDISRGDVIVKAQASENDSLKISNTVNATIVWMNDKPAVPGKEYLIKHLTTKVSGQIASIEHVINVNTLETNAADALQLNDIASCNIEFTKQLVLEPYAKNRIMGSFIIIDKISHSTVGAGMITSVLDNNDDTRITREYSAFEQDLNALVRKHFPEWGTKSINEVLG